MPLIDLLASYPALAVASALLLGLLVGSFLNVVVYRLPVMLHRQWERQARDVLGLDETPKTAPFNLLLPASHCTHCQHVIRPWENIPILSWLLLRGKCSACQAAISPRYPLVELASGLIAAWLIGHFGVTWQGGAMLLLSWTLLAAGLIDIDEQLLPDVLVLPLLWLGLIINSTGLFVALPDALWGAVLGYLSLWLVFWVFKLITGKEGMGHGDFKLLATLGAWGGWQVLLPSILLSSVAGVILGSIWLRLQNAGRSTPFAFGPFLAIAGWVALIWGDSLTKAYLRVTGLG